MTKRMFHKVFHGPGIIRLIAFSILKIGYVRRPRYIDRILKTRFSLLSSRSIFSLVIWRFFQIPSRIFVKLPVSNKTLFSYNTYKNYNNMSVEIMILFHEI